MNYIEWALQRGAELWRAREEALKKRLSLVPEGTAQKKAAEAQLSEEEAAAQDAEMSGGAETVAEAADDPVETAAVRLGQKLGLGATQEDGDGVFCRFGGHCGGERCASAREGGRERGQCVRLDKKAPERGRPRRGERGGSAREK